VGARVLSAVLRAAEAPQVVPVGGEGEVGRRSSGHLDGEGGIEGDGSGPCVSRGHQGRRRGGGRGPAGGDGEGGVGCGWQVYTIAQLINSHPLLDEIKVIY